MGILGDAADFKTLGAAIVDTGSEKQIGDVQTAVLESTNPNQHVNTRSVLSQVVGNLAQVPLPQNNSLEAVLSYQTKMLGQGVQGFQAIAGESAQNIEERTALTEKIGEAHNAVIDKENTNALRVSISIANTDDLAKQAVESNAKLQYDLLNKVGASISESQRLAETTANSDAPILDRVGAIWGKIVADVQTEDYNKQLQTVSAAVQSAQAARQNNFNMALNREKLAYDPDLAKARVDVAKLTALIEVSKAKGESTEAARKSISDILSGVNALSGAKLQQEQGRRELQAANQRIGMMSMQMDAMKDAKLKQAQDDAFEGYVADTLKIDHAAVRAWKSANPESASKFIPVIAAGYRNAANGGPLVVDSRALLTEMQNQTPQPGLMDAVSMVRATTSAFDPEANKLAAIQDNLYMSVSSNEATKKQLLANKDYKAAQAILDNPAAPQKQRVEAQQRQLDILKKTVKINPYNEFANQADSPFRFDKMLAHYSVDTYKSMGVPGVNEKVLDVVNNSKYDNSVQLANALIERADVPQKDVYALVAGMSKAAANATYERMKLNTVGIAPPTEMNMIIPGTIAVQKLFGTTTSKIPQTINMFDPMQLETLARSQQYGAKLEGQRIAPSEAPGTTGRKPGEM